MASPYFAGDYTQGLRQLSRPTILIVVLPSRFLLSAIDFTLEQLAFKRILCALLRHESTSGVWV
jgi:hypothetical protein